MGRLSWCGRQAERAVALSDLTNAGALAYAQGRLRRLGVDRALSRAGARDGDRAGMRWYGHLEFDWEPDPSRPAGDPPGRTVVVKIGTSSITDAEGRVAPRRWPSWPGRWPSSGPGQRRDRDLGRSPPGCGCSACTRGRPTPPCSRPCPPWARAGYGPLRAGADAAGLVGGQVLLAPLDFAPGQYLHARQTLGPLLGLGVVPVVNENDAVADDEVRFGDNDRLAALVAHLVQADLLVLLTDAAGLFTADPRKRRSVVG